MKETQKVAFTTLVERLSAKLDYPLGMNHLAVLISGWRKKHPDQVPNINTLSMRKKHDGYAWLTAAETAFLSRYAGYDLSKK